MKIWQILAFAAPVTAVLLLVSMQSRHDTIVRIERAEVQQQLHESKFDRDFRAAWGGRSLAPAASADEREARLQQRLDDLDQQVEQSLKQSEQDTADLRRALDELPAPGPVK